MSKPAVVSTLAASLTRWAATFVQEIRDASGASFLQLVNEVIKASGRNHSFVISERLGRTSSKEQYGLIYDPERVQVLRTWQYPVANDTFERPPFTAESAPLALACLAALSLVQFSAAA